MQRSHEMPRTRRKGRGRVKLIAEWVLPIKTVSELNQREHWREKHKRHKIQKMQVKMRFREFNGLLAPPLHIIIIRCMPRMLDSDNLPGALKCVRDALADCIIPGLQAGRADDPKYGLTFEVKQEKAKQKGVKIQIYEISTLELQVLDSTFFKSID